MNNYTLFLVSCAECLCTCWFVYGDIQPHLRVLQVAALVISVALTGICFAGAVDQYEYERENGASVPDEWSDLLEVPK